MTDHTSSPSTATDDTADADDSDRDGGRWFGNSEAIAETLGLTPDELGEAREAGLTIAEIAAALSVDVDEVVQTILEDKAQRLEEKVAAGVITEEEAAERFAEAEVTAVEKVNSDRRS